MKDNERLWYSDKYPGIPFDGDYKFDKNGNRNLGLESVSGKKKRITLRSWQEAKSKGWVLR